MSPELETLDQLLCGELSLVIISKLYSDTDRFLRGVHGLLSEGHVCLFTSAGVEVPAWRWRQLFLEGTVVDEIESFRLEITEHGARRVS